MLLPGWSWGRMKFFIVVFLGALTMIRRAQQRNYFSKLEQPESIFGVFPPLEEQGIANLKDSVEEGNIQRVVTILQNNIKQWSFIEAQLLEPNVNLGMPEIFIPLKHLTTTLEILGNIFFMKNEFVEAQNCLERACPLMELLPASLLENLAQQAGNGRDTFGGFDKPPIGFDKKANKHNSHNPQAPNYAADCFAVLRKVYLKVYGDRLSFDGEHRLLGDGSEEVDDDNPRKAFNDNDSSIDNDNDDNNDGDDDGEFNIESKIEELRQPFQHLRSELMMVHSNKEGDMSDDSDYADYNHNDEDEDDLAEVDPRARTDEDLSGDGVDRPFFDRPPQLVRQNNVHLDSNKRGGTSALNPDGLKFQSSSKFRDVFLGGLHGYAREYGGSSQMAEGDGFQSMHDPHLLGLGGSATSLIAADMEIMLRKFVKEDDPGRRELFEVARKYYEDLDVNFPNMDLHEYAANMELGTVYLEIMARVVNEGFAFIAPELERWQEFGQSLLLRGTSSAVPSASSGAMNLVAEAERKNRFGVGIIWEIDPDTGHKKEFAVELDGSYFDSFSLQERNRLLVLSAFDIAFNLEPDEHFDLSLGFSLGVLDNDKTRHRDAYFSHYDDTALGDNPHYNNNNNNGQHQGHHGLGQLRKHKEPKRKPRQKSANVENDVTAAMFEDQTLSTIGITSAMRSSVPTLKAEDDWTLHLFLVFMLATALVVYVSYHDTRNKTKSRSKVLRNPQQRSGNGSGRAGGNGNGLNSNNSAPDGFLGLCIRYFYPQYLDTTGDGSNQNNALSEAIDTATFVSELSIMFVGTDIPAWIVSLIAEATSSSSNSNNSGKSNGNGNGSNSNTSSSGGQSKKNGNSSNGDKKNSQQQQSMSSHGLLSYIKEVFLGLYTKLNTSTADSLANSLPAPSISASATSSGKTSKSPKSSNHASTTTSGSSSTVTLSSSAIPHVSSPLAPAIPLKPSAADMKAAAAEATDSCTEDSECSADALLLSKKTGAVNNISNSNQNQLTTAAAHGSQGSKAVSFADHGSGINTRQGSATAPTPSSTSAVPVHKVTKPRSKDDDHLNTNNHNKSSQHQQQLQTSSKSTSNNNGTKTAAPLAPSLTSAGVEAVKDQKTDISVYEDYYYGTPQQQSEEEGWQSAAHGHHKRASKTPSTTATSSHSNKGSTSVRTPATPPTSTVGTSSTPTTTATGASAGWKTASPALTGKPQPKATGSFSTDNSGYKRSPQVETLGNGGASLLRTGSHHESGYESGSSHHGSFYDALMVKPLPAAASGSAPSSAPGSAAGAGPVSYAQRLSLGASASGSGPSATTTSAASTGASTSTVSSVGGRTNYKLALAGNVSSPATTSLSSTTTQESNANSLSSTTIYEQQQQDLHYDQQQQLLFPASSAESSPGLMGFASTTETLHLDTGDIDFDAVGGLLSETSPLRLDFMSGLGLSSMLGGSGLTNNIDPPLDAFSTASNSPTKLPVASSQPPPGLGGVLHATNSNHSLLGGRVNSGNNSGLGAFGGGFEHNPFATNRSGHDVNCSGHSNSSNANNGNAFAQLFSSHNHDSVGSTSLLPGTNSTLQQHHHAVVEEDGYVTTFLSHMLDDILLPSPTSTSATSTAATTSSGLDLFGNSHSFLGPATPGPQKHSLNSGGMSSNVGNAHGHGGGGLLSSLLGSDYMGGSILGDAMGPGSLLLRGEAADRSLISDLSADAPVFLPSNMLTSTDNLSFLDFDVNMNLLQGDVVVQEVGEEGANATDQV